MELKKKYSYKKLVPVDNRKEKKEKKRKEKKRKIERKKKECR